MIGTKVTVRLRMGAHDAHYAGELIKMGNTSRQIRFEARKVIANVRERGMAPSAADVLPEPIVVCRAIGTCVTPKDMQRKPRGLYMTALPVHTPTGPGPIVTPTSEGGGPRTLPTIEKHAPDAILTAAIVGAELTRQQTPHLPITPQEIADEAARCREAGASVIHLHVRNDDGSNTQSKERFAATIDAIRKKTDCIIQVSTGGAVGMSIDERVGPLACNPEMATLNCGSLNFGDDVFVNTRPQIKDIALRLKASGAVAELECYEVGHIEEALALAEKGIIPRPLHFQFVLGVAGGIGASEENVRYMVSLLPADASWAVAATGRHQQPMTELAMRLGGHARVGLEDNIYLTKGVLSEGSAPLVARAAAYARSIGRTPVDPARARAILLAKASA